MKKLNFIFIALMVSCMGNNSTEIRKPFEVNRSLTVDFLLDNGYKQLYGDDVLLFGKEIDNIMVYYQIDLPELSDKDTDNFDFWNLLKKHGVISFKNYQKEIKEDEYYRLKDSISKSNLKVIEFKDEEYINLKDRFKVVNLKTKDTFNCSLEKEEEKLLFNSYIVY